MITADQAKERLNRILAARRTAGLDAFPKFSQDRPDKEEWTSHPLEIWRPDGDLDAGKQFRDEWKDRSPKHRERNRQEKHILQNEPALTRNETLQRVVRAERVPAQIDQADGAKEGQTDEREEGRPQRGFGEGMHRTNHTSAGDERSE